MTAFWWEVAQSCVSSSGFLSFDDFMALSLYHPEQGYYMREALEWGDKGDFTTAPMISSGFAYALGTTAFELNPRAKICVELGPGRGDLAKQLLTCFPKIEEYWCIEPSEALQERQKAFLKSKLTEKAFSSLRWSKCVPSCENAVLVANEILDAQVAKQVTYYQGRFQEKGFRWSNGQWSSAVQPLSSELEEYCCFLEIPKTDGYTTEIRPNLDPWFDVLEPMKSGYCFLIDYGYLRKQYYHPERKNGTLRSYKKHRFCHDPERWMGQVDVSVSVDWDQVGEIALRKGWSLHSFQTQAEWLMQHSVPQEHRSGLVELIHSEMGENIKIAIIKK